MAWFKREDGFHWLNMSPGGEGRLSVELVAEKVKDWFLTGRPLPQEWDGSSLKKLVRVIFKDSNIKSLFLDKRARKGAYAVHVC